MLLFNTGSTVIAILKDESVFKEPTPLKNE